jgi:transcriptional regulator with XRE-family HTH domain/tetratricopeptide (TPR) repeat protein
VGTETSAGFGDVLRRFRFVAGLSQEELAERAGMSAHGISDLERGARTRPYLATVQRLAEALRLSTAEVAQLRAASGRAPAPAPSLSPSAPAVDDLAVDQTPMVCRAAELDRVLSALDDTITGRGRLVMLAGEPGVGKTRLAREALVRARARGLPGYIGRCFEQHAAVPFFPFGEPFSTALAAAPLEMEAELRSRWPELGHIVPEHGRPPSAAGQETQLQVFRAAAGVLHALAALHPVVLMLDDLHWADRTSLGLLLYLSRKLHDTRALILGTYREAEVGRQHPLEATLRELVREHLVDEIHVERLSLAGTGELVESRLGTAAVPHEVVALIHERAQGNPFFTEELLADLIEQGAVSASGSPPASLADRRVPRSIRLVVDERVGRLPTEAQQLLQLASVVGQEFALDLLLAASDRPQDEVYAALDAILAARLVIELQASFGGRFAFIHALVQQTLYEELPAHRRRAAHLRIGEVLERLAPRDPAVAAGLARHFLHGGDAVRAATYALQAGDDAARRYAHAEAAHYYTIALQAVSSAGEAARAADIQCRLAAELVDLDHSSEALAAYEAALESATPRGDQAVQARARWGLGRLELNRYNMAAAGSHLDLALQVWPPERDPAELVQLLVDAVRAKVFSGQPSGALDLADRAVALAEQLADPGLLARALVGLEEVQGQAGHVRDRQLIELLERAEALAREAGDWRTLTRALLNQSVNLSNAGQLEQCLAANRRAVEAADRSGDTQRLRFAWQALGLECVAAGAWEEGRSAARAGLALARGSGFNGVAGPAALAWMEGRHEDALAHFRSFWAESVEQHDMQGAAYATALLADALLQLDRPAEAEDPAREAAELTRGRWPLMTGFVTPLVEALVCLRAPDAEEVLLEAERRIEQTDKAIARPQLLRARGRLLMQRGQLGDAMDALQRSAAIARAQRALVELGRALAVLADAVRAQGNETLAAQADTEREAVVEQIGPEVRGLAWARGVPVETSDPGERVSSSARG